MKPFIRLALLSVSLALFPLAKTMSHDGTIYITGTIKNKTCVISPDSEHLVVTMTQVHATQLEKAKMRHRMSGSRLTSSSAGRGLTALPPVSKEHLTDKTTRFWRLPRRKIAPAVLQSAFSTPINPAAAERRAFLCAYRKSNDRRARFLCPLSRRHRYRHPGYRKRGSNFCFDLCLNMSCRRKYSRFH